MFSSIGKAMFFAALGATVLMGFESTSARADQVTINVISEASVKVQIEFYSQSRPYAWPGGGMAYDLNDYETHAFTLNCRSGEKICFGAWVTGNASRYWGVGANNRYGCEKCCFICGAGDYPTQVLND